MVRRIGWLLLATLSGSGAFGQTAEQSIAAKLQNGPFVLLRGMYAGNDLHFDAQGNLIGSAETLPFSLSAVVIEKIRLNDSDLTIEGKHARLEFEPTDGRGEPKKTRVVPLNGKLRPNVAITVARDAAHPGALDAALDKVFAVGFDDALVDAAPWCWRPWLRHAVHPNLPIDSDLPGVAKIDPKAGVSAPILRYSPDPPYSEVAKEAHVQGVCVVGMVVDAQGRPKGAWIVRPVGDGLDEQAIAAVSQYRFSPARDHGRPVPVRINIQVNFRIW